ncbi:MAG: hypothetical protein IC227_03715 [Enterococcus lacertideformus]|uniref:Uncharacterized protein n=1 Tax=Enterococcus lacertideformus TaxID=2771493 RepID=A0A931F8A7_9ENTE|nr:hypothetical protein [Enterococcus lacertideformus]
MRKCDSILNNYYNQKMTSDKSNNTKKNVLKTDKHTGKHTDNYSKVVQELSEKQKGTKVEFTTKVQQAKTKTEFTTKVQQAKTKKIKIKTS